MSGRDFRTPENVKPFPLDSMPSPLKEFIEEGANALQCPPDFQGVLLLPLLGTAVGSGYRLRLKKGFGVTAAHYAAIVSLPGTAKSPAFDQVGRPIYSWQKCLQKIHEKDLAEWERAKETAEDDNTPRPVLQRVVVEDTTAEALAKILAENARGVILYMDELSGWVAGMNSYKGGKGNDRQFYMKAWSGSNLIIDRKTQLEPLIIEDPFLAIAGTIQPDVLHSLVHEAKYNDGFMDRILFAYPETKTPLHWSDAEVATETQTHVDGVFRKLFEMPSSGAPTTLDSKAESLFRDWYACHQGEIRELPQNLMGVWGKMPAHCGRLILTVHMASWAADGGDHMSVDAKSVTRGIALAEYFKSHAKKAYAVVGETAESRNIRRVSEWMIRTGKSIVRPRDLLNCKIAADSATATSLLDEMSKRQMGQWINLPPSAKGHERPKAFTLFSQHSALGTDTQGKSLA